MIQVSVGSEDGNLQKSSTMEIGVKPVVTLLAVLASLTFLVGCTVERDRAEAVALAARVHDEMRLGDFAAAYKESAPRFKTVGSESDFVTWMSKFQEKFGPLKNANEIAYQTGLDSRIGRTHLLVFDLQYDHGRARESMILVRSESGEMQLWKLGIQPVD